MTEQEEWTTADVAKFLDIDRRKVAQTLTRWGVQPLPHRRETGRHGGFTTTLYRAADVIQADRDRPRGRRPKNPETQP